MLSFTVVSGAMASGAHASSVLVLDGTPASDPSIVTPGGGAEKAASSIVAVGAGQPGATASRSVIALGNADVNAETVAAVPAGTARPRAGGVLVIRAGMVGGSSAAPAAAAAASAPASAAGGKDDGKPRTLRDAMTQAGRAPAVPQ